MRLATPDAPIAPEEAMVGRFAARLVVHSKNPVTTITRDQLAKMLLEEIKTWDALGGPPKPIRFVGPNFVSLAGYIVDQYAGPNHRYPIHWEEKANSSEVFAAVQEDPLAIGFVLAQPDDVLGKNLRQLEVGDEQPEAFTPANVYNGRWPLQASICFRSSATYPSLKNIARLCETPKGAEILARYYVWPEANAAGVLKAERLAIAASGKGERVTAVGPREAEPILKAVATCYVEDEAPIQLGFRAGVAEESRKRFSEGGVDCCVADDHDAHEPQPQGDRDDRPSASLRVPLGRQVTVVIVNRDNAIHSLSIDELRAIYSGKTKTWPTPVGGQAVIQRLKLPEADENAKLFLTKVLGGKPPVAARQLKSGRDVVQAVIATPNAVGYASLLDVTGADNGVRVVPLVADAGAPLLPDNPEYFLERVWTLHVSADAKPAARSVAAFLANGLADRGLAGAGLLPPRGRTIENARPASD
jgi:ABC-type phosphate transport system substrate-binding protein